MFERLEYIKNLLFQKVKVFVFDGSDLTTAWSKIPLAGSYLQVRLHSKYADSGVEICVNQLDSQPIPLVDGMKYNIFFKEIWVRSNGVGNSSKIYFYAGHFKDQIEQNTQAELSRILATSALTTGIAFTKTVQTNCKKMKISFFHVLAGGGVINFDLAISSSHFTGAPIYYINDTEFNNESFEIEIDCIGVKNITILLTNRHANSLSSTYQFTME